MEIFGIGPGELILVFILVLIFIGPSKMPEVAASLGKAIREFQRASAELGDALNAEIAAAQAEKAAREHATENGHAASAEAVEAEVVAEPVDTPVNPEIAPVAYAGAAPYPELPQLDSTPGAEPEQQPAAAAEATPEPVAEPSAQPVRAPAIAPQPADLDGLAPLPLALLAPSEPHANGTATGPPAAPRLAETTPAAAATPAGDGGDGGTAATGDGPGRAEAVAGPGDDAPVVGQPVVAADEPAPAPARGELAAVGEKAGQAEV